MRYRSWAFLVIFLFVVSVRATAQQAATVCSETHIVKGRILAPGANFGTNYEILQLDEARIAGWAYTDSKGEFVLPEQPAGQYYIVARIDGFKEYKQRIDVDLCGKFYDYNIFMEFDDEVVRPVILDFTGEVKEVVDVAELKRVFPKKAVDDFERARSERLSAEQDRARTRLEKLIAQYPDFYDARNALGSVYLEMKRFRDAEAQYNQARKLKPNSAAPLVSLGSLYVQEADASLNPVPGVTGVLVGKDLGLILNDARDVLSEAIKIKPDAAFAYYLMGIADTRARNYPRAEQALRKAFDLEPKLRWARLALANMYISQGKLKEALLELEAYLTEFPKKANRTEVEKTRARVAAELAKGSK